MLSVTVQSEQGCKRKIITGIKDKEKRKLVEGKEEEISGQKKIK
jgi:hypothetical protein